MHSASIRYEYEVGGKQYRGQRIAFGPTVASSSKSPALRDLASYPLGKIVDVRFSPSRPELSVLLPGANWDLYAATFLGAVLTAIGIGLLVRDLFQGS